MIPSGFTSIAVQNQKGDLIRYLRSIISSPIVVRYPSGGAPDKSLPTEGDLKGMRFIRADNDDEVIPRRT